MSGWEGQREPMLSPPVGALRRRRDWRAESVERALLGSDRARLSDREHAVARAMHLGFVARIEDGLRERMVSRLDRARYPMLTASLETRRVRIADAVLLAAGVPVDDELTRVILRRLDDDRLARLAEAARDPTQSLADPLLDHDDLAIAQASAALLTAEAARFDRFGEPRLVDGDFPRETRDRCVWTVAAALARYLCVHHEMAAGEADRLVSDAATEMLGLRAEEGADAAAERLVALLDARAALDERVIAEALAGGRISFFVAALAHCAGFPAAHCRSVVAGVPGQGLLALLHAAEMSRESAMQVFSILSDDAMALARAYDLADPAEMAEILRVWRLDPTYRDALAMMGQGRAR